MSDMKQNQTTWLTTKNLVIASIGGAALYYLWVEHHSHLIYFLPYLIFLLCPFMHFFMHRGHKHDNGGHHASGQATSHVVDETEPSHELQGNGKCEENIGKEKRDRE